MRFMNEVVSSVQSFWNGEQNRKPNPKRPVLNIPRPNFQTSPVEILCLDVSGSMGADDYPPTRLDGAKQASLSFISRIAEHNPKSMIGIVGFSDSASLVSPPLSVSNRMSELQQSINSLHVSLSTNMPAGLKLAGKMIAQCRNVVNPRILLLTDGHSNAGGSPVTVAERLKSQGIQIDIIGIGGSPADVNESELRAMASIINVEIRYWFVTSTFQLIKKFENLAIREVS